jgi:EmrB/QacA subfamily drug resistance transporter
MKTTKTEELECPHVILSSRRRRAVTVGVMLGLFIAALEATVVGTAMPTVIASLGGVNHYSWVVSAYLVTATVTIPVWGRLSDLYGRRPLYLIGVATFLAGSALSGASASITQLILFRALQGLGAGALVPLSLTINGDIYTLRERTQVQGLFSGVWGLASIVGPLAGGLITDQLSWRWVFYINIPFGLAAALIVGTALKEPKREERPVIDYAGSASLAIGITLLLVALVEAGNPAMRKSPLIAAAVVGMLIFGAMFVRAERNAREPILPFSLFRNRLLLVASIINFMIGTAMFGALTFVPLFVQGALGGTATEAGSVLTPFLLGWVTLSVIGGRLMLRVGYRPTVIAGLIFIAVAFAVLATFGQGTHRAWLLGDVAVMGSGIGLVALILLITSQNSVPREELGIATSLNQFFRLIGGAVGVAALGTVLTMGLSAQMSDIQESSGLPREQVSSIVENPSALLEPSERAKLAAPLLLAMKTGLAHALHNVFILGAVFAALALAAGFWLPAHWTKREPNLEPPNSYSAKECERLLMADMTAIDPKNEPVAEMRD